MNIFYKTTCLKEYLLRLKKQGKSIGFVPTMGALHQGHLELVLHSKRSNDITVCSIFVNPTQFNNPDDLEKYPRMPEKDIEMLEKSNCDVLFMPSYEEVYPENDDNTYDFGGIENLLEGKFRPGHFQGVAMVVKNLFEIVEPNDAYFGLKDYQQYVIINKLVENFQLPVNITGCPTVREEDGLAMSSRNLRLNNKQRKAAPLIYESLKFIKGNFNEKPISEWKEWFSQQINNNPELNVEYVEIVDAHTLTAPDTSTPSNMVALAAVFAGEIRLIDNVLINY